MSNYTVFAQYYDRLLKNAEYEVRSEYISGFFNAYGINGGKLLDLACGTGEFSKYFSQKGFEVTGIDLSEDMLTVAKSKCPDAKFIKGDISSFELSEKYDCCICCLDSLNHLTEKEEWINCFKSVYKALKTDGLFIFDVNSVYKHNNVLAGNSFVFDEDDFFLAWDNEDLGDNRVRIFLDFFINNGKNYDRYSECFDELAFEIKDIKEMLSDFDILGIYGDLSDKSPEYNEERVYFVCKRK